MANEQIVAEIILKALMDGASKATFDNAADGLKKVEGASEKTGFSLTDVKSAIDMTIGGLRQLAQVAQGAIEFAQLGAQAEQTEINFARLSERLGLTGDYLQRLRAASNGTVDDLKLMQGVSVLTAGATGELESAMAGAYPTLLEYAKAAAALNPQLGDVDYMLNSIAVGIKRGSPLILDNLGIVVKVEEANKNYAATLGKTVEELTGAEKQMALLNGVLGAGKVLVDQVGGSTKSLTDSFAQAKTATSNLKDEVAILWNELLAASDAMVLFAESIDVLTDDVRLRAAIKHTQDLGLMVGDIAKAYREWQVSPVDEDSPKRLRDLLVLLTEELDRYNDMLVLQNQVEGEHAALVDRRLRDQNREEVAIRMTTDAIADMEQQDEWLIDVLKRHEREARAAAEATEALAAKTEYLKEGIGELALGAALAATALVGDAKAKEELAEAILTARQAWADEFQAILDNKDGIDDLIRQHGRLVTVAASTTEEHDDATLAMLEANEAAGKLAEAEKELAENSDPEKQNALQMAVLRARDAFREATGEAEGLNAGLTEGYDYTTNLTGKIDKELTKALYDSAKAAGADAGELALLALATGDFTEAQLDAALKTAATQEKIELLGKAIAEDKISVSEAKDELIKFRDELLGLPGETTVAVSLDEDKLEAAENALARIKAALEAIGNTPWTADVTVYEHRWGGEEQGW